MVAPVVLVIRATSRWRDARWMAQARHRPANIIALLSTIISCSPMGCRMKGFTPPWWQRTA
jgi:hypothetical protein